MLRGSGVKWDLRKSLTYEIYENLKFKIPVGVKGDCYDRFLIRIYEMRESLKIIKELQCKFERKIITEALEFKDFKPSTEEFQNYYQSNPEKPFCKNYINPKLQFLIDTYSENVDKTKVFHLTKTV